MRRGETWTAAAGGDDTGKPRPVVILQDDRCDATDSVTVCAFTTNSAEAPLFRVAVQPTERNGLDSPSSIMADRIVTVRRRRVATYIGRLDDDDELRLNRAIAVFLGLAGSSRGRRRRS